MSYNARVKATQNRAGGLRGYDRWWLPGSSQASAIGIRANLVKTVRTRTNTLVTPHSVGWLTKPYMNWCPLNETTLADTRCLVVQQNQLNGVARGRAQNASLSNGGIQFAKYFRYKNNTNNPNSLNCPSGCDRFSPWCRICIN